MKLLDDYLALLEQIHKYFGYVEDWKAIPLEDSRKYYWRLYGTGPDSVRFASHSEILDDEEGNYYEDEIYTQRHLPKWVYRGKKYTMVCVDTHTDGNHFLRIFENSKEIKEKPIC